MQDTNRVSYFQVKNYLSNVAKIRLNQIKTALPVVH